jgi:hypothetical protein
MKGETGVKAEKDSKPQRIFCVDFLRGLDIFYLAAIHYALLSPGVFRVLSNRVLIHSPLFF